MNKSTKEYYYKIYLLNGIEFDSLEIPIPRGFSKDISNLGVMIDNGYIEWYDDGIFKSTDKFLEEI